MPAPEINDERVSLHMYKGVYFPMAYSFPGRINPGIKHPDIYATTIAENIINIIFRDLLLDIFFDKTFHDDINPIITITEGIISTVTVKLISGFIVLQITNTINVINITKQ